MIGYIVLLVSPDIALDVICYAKSRPPPPSQNETKSHKWAASTTPEHHTSAKKKSHPSGPAAVSDFASALREMASSFVETDNGDPSTPQRQSMAIQAVETKSSTVGSASRLCVS